MLWGVTLGKNRGHFLFIYIIEACPRFFPPVPPFLSKKHNLLLIKNKYNLSISYTIFTNFNFILNSTDV